MPSRARFTVLALLLTLSVACKVGPSYEFDKVKPLNDSANALHDQASAILGEVIDKYQAINAEAQKSDDPFEELARQQGPLKDLEIKLATAKGKMTEAAAKYEEVARLNLPDWYKQYSTTTADLNRGSVELADLFAELIKNTYDTSIQTEQELDAKQAAVGEKIQALNKRMSDLKAARTKIEGEHKGDLTK